MSVYCLALKSADAKTDTSATVIQNAEIARITRHFHGRYAKSRRWPKITAHDQDHGIVTVIVNT